MPTPRTWYCPNGCNVFDSSSYYDDSPPECGACGRRMVTEPTEFDDAHERREVAEIAKVQTELVK